MNLLYIAGGTYPYGSAYSTRVKGFIGLFNSLGYNVHVLADYYVPGEKNVSANKNVYKNTYATVGKKVSLIERITLPYKCKKELINYLNENTADIVILRSLSDRFSKLFGMLKKRGIPVILESCEWYHYSNWKGGILNPWFIQFYFCWKFKFKKADGVIAISRFLAKHYLKTKKNVFRIPTILDSGTITCTFETSNDKIVIMYAGNPGKSKEVFAPILTALQMMGKDSEKIILNIFGVNEKNIRRNLGKKSYLLDSVKNSVRIYGKVSQSQIHDEYAKSDYSIFLRPDRRSSHAGFPTKLAESMLAGTPVICNNTGDIGMYIDKSNGFLLESSEPSEIKEAFLKLLLLSKDEKHKFRANAKSTAHKYFNYNMYVNDVKVFLEKIMRNQGLI